MGEYIPMMERGLLEGLAKGRQEGIEKGMEKGIEKGRQEIALKLLQTNMTPQQVCEVTGLSMKEINTLSKK